MRGMMFWGEGGRDRALVSCTHRVTLQGPFSELFIIVLSMICTFSPQKVIINVYDPVVSKV